MRIPSSAYKIPGSIDPATAESVAKSNDSKKVDNGRDGSTTAKRDENESRIHVSHKARVLANESALDVVKIERLRGMLNRGDFKIDARAIAARIVNGE
jgi:anti-sigma28 factor (negative regulator of flagellin synthesis)